MLAVLDFLVYSMRRTRISIPLPISVEDFTIVYNSNTKFQVSRSKLGLYSTFFRNLPHLFKLDSFDIVDSATNETFQEFIYAVQGKEFKLSENSFFDFLRLFSNYEVENAIPVCTKYFHYKPQISQVLKETKRANSENLSKYQRVLNDLIASHLDACLQDPEFITLPYSVVNAILSSKEKVLNDRKLLHNFLINLIPTLDTAAYDLFSHIELQDLEEAEIKQIFNNLQLMKYFSSKKEITTHSYSDILSDFQEIKNYAKHIDKRIKKLERIKFQDQFEGISDQFCDIEDRIEAEAKRRQEEARKDFNQDSKVEKKLKQMADKFAFTTMDVIQRIKKQDSLQNAHLKELDVRTQTLQSQFEPFRAEIREMQRMLRVANVRQISITEHINEHAKQRKEEKDDTQINSSIHEEEETVDLS